MAQVAKTWRRVWNFQDQCPSARRGQPIESAFDEGSEVDAAGGGGGKHGDRLRPLLGRASLSSDRVSMTWRSMLMRRRARSTRLARRGDVFSPAHAAVGDEQDLRFPPPHVDPTLFTNLYSHVTPTMRKEAAARLGDALFGPATEDEVHTERHGPAPDHRS